MDLLINVDPASPTPLHRQVYEELRRAIFSGRLPGGKKVPSTRTLARTLGVSRATVTLAYDYLLGEGYFEAQGGSGTYVSRKLPDDLIQAAPVGADMSRPLPGPRSLSSYGSALREREWLDYSDVEPEIQFSFGRPDLDEFPMRIWSQLMTRHCRNSNFTLLDCPSRAAGYLPLRQAISSYLARARALPCKPEQVIVVNGSQQGLDLVTRVVLDPGDRAGIEEPGYIGAQKAFQAQGARLEPIFIDSNGVKTDYLKARFETDGPDRLKLLYLTPSHQYPTGVVLSLGRRMEILSFASRTGCLIIEDDYDSEYRYSGRPIPALAGIDHGGSVIYVGTFSKVILPALRLGYLVVPEDLVEVFTRAKWLVDRHSSLLQQQVLADFIAEGHLERHVRRMRALYEKKRQLVMEMLEGLFEDRVQISGENAGINILVRIESGLSDRELMKRAAETGIGITSTAQLYLSQAPRGEFLLNYGGIEESDLIEGLTRLRAIVD